MTQTPVQLLKPDTLCLGNVVTLNSVNYKMTVTAVDLEARTAEVTWINMRGEPECLDAVPWACLTLVGAGA